VAGHGSEGAKKAPPVRVLPHELIVRASTAARPRRRSVR
jgi:hypothetical protein